MNTKFSNTDTLLTTVETNLTTLVNTNTSNIDSSIDTLIGNVGTIETNITNHINGVSSTLSNEFDTKIGEIKNDINTIMLVNKLNVSDATVERVLAFLKNNSIIKRIGSNKTGYWEELK